MEIDRTSPVPPWQQLAAILREQIASGQITGRLPGERYLSQEHGLAMITVRKAIAKLRAEGIVVTVKGMGSYVRADPER